MGWAVLKFNSDAAYLNALFLGLLVVFLFEALPEELAFRGFIYSNLNTKFARWKSGLITVGLFVLLPVLLTPVQKYVLGMQDVYVGGSSSIAVSYVITMFLFGSFVQYLRILTGTIWTGVGFHLLFVYINHLIGLDANKLIQFTEVTNESGLQIAFGISLLLMFLSLILYPKISGKSLGWKRIDNQNENTDTRQE
jgi:membrane protease YdiL (CAAX protease family)